MLPECLPVGDDCAIVPNDPRGRPGEVPPFAACSGVLVSDVSPVFVTAAHCIDFFDNLIVVRSGVHFATQYDPADPPRLIPVQSYARHPDYSPNSFMNDIGVVVLKRTPNVALAELPAAGLLDDMKAAGTIEGQSFVGVGYGCAPTPNAQMACPYDGVRRSGVFQFRALASDWLLLSNRSGAGMCTGDSGGPLFVGGSDTEAALMSWEDTQCRASAFGIRLDTRSARAFLADWIAGSD